MWTKATDMPINVKRFCMLYSQLGIGKSIKDPNQSIAQPPFLPLQRDRKAMVRKILLLVMECNWRLLPVRK
jgi:hypothetical protein